jgi:hypothetical protein
MKIRITVEWMPIHILVGGAIFSIYGLGGVVFGDYKWAYALVLLLGVVMFTSRHLVVIDRQNKQYSDFYWVLGMKVQNYTASFEKLLSLTITSGTYTQQYGMYVRRHISGTIYKMYLDLADDEPIYIGQSKSMSKIRSRADKLSSSLGIALRDTTQD